MKQIPLTQGQFALVDDEDYEYLMQWKWYALYDKKGKVFYARRNFSIGQGKQSSIPIHRQILNLKDSSIQVDHIDHNPLNNCRSNIRIASSSQNLSNRASRINSASKFVGVSWLKKNRKWQAGIKKHGIQFYLGTYHSEVDAARAYDKKALELHGEFANLNFKNISPEP